MLAISDVVWQAGIAAVLALGLAWINMRQGKKLDDIHTLVNSNYGASLKTSAVALRRVATISKAKPDIDAALLAERLLREHQDSQARLDAGK